MELSLLNLLLVLVAAWLGGLLATRLGYPSVLGELLAGMLLGPPLLGVLHGSEALAVVGELGVLLMLLYIGMEIDPQELGRASKGGVLAALGGFITPFVACYLLIYSVTGSAYAAMFVGVAAGVTSLATKSRILVDLQLLDTRIAHVMMAGALITDTLSLLIFAGVIGVAQFGSVSMVQLSVVGLKALAFFSVAALAGLKLIPRFGAWLQRYAPGRTVSFLLIVVLALLYAEGAELAGLHGILGAFLAGLFLRERTLGRTLSRDLMDLVRDVSLGFLAPVFFVMAGFEVTFEVFWEHPVLLASVIVLATLAKIIGTALFYLPTGYGWREGLVLGAGMNGRGAVEIIIAQIGLSLGIIDTTIFSILVFMAIFTTATVPVLLKLGVDWLKRRGELVRSDHERRGVLIIGAGTTARALGRVLARSQPVWVVDRNPQLCALAEKDGLQARCGDALDEQVLSEAQAAHVRTFIAMTGNAEVNALAAQLARTVFYVPEIHVLFSGGDEAEHQSLLTHLHATTLFAGSVSLAAWDYRIEQERIVRSKVRVEQAGSAARFFRALQGPRPTLPLAVLREDQYWAVHSGLTLQPGDEVIVLQAVDVVAVPRDRFDRLVAEASVLDLARQLSLEEFFRKASEALAARLELDAETLQQRFLDREALSSTVVFPGVAIPHVIVEGQGRFELLVARCREGLQFPGQPERVHAVFVLARSEDERTFHLQALSAIAQILQREDFEQAWLAAAGPEALRRLLLESERRRLPLPAGSEPGEALPEA
ncbi:cation:proton antiporter domain-containing protein [Rhodothermus profundi]|uniref:Kef-type K+ transport system, membrane component KefB n=1 Tax=Rhodothermus profundi TaxID=633813 RepID=A0A1M6RIN4_9BACT|nr:cation:proton antiporter [Rhodothermus profundi]SHK32228.1 Kef-type K+ transport system, membrane component KefB [Rhodothermus profundi]